MNQPLFVIFFQFKPQITDINLDDVGISHKIITPNFFENLISGKNLTGIGKKIL